jgi:hypothetical protein
MPLRQYFSCVGGVLLAVLFILDAWFPKPPVVERAPGNLPIIRIHSDRKWPDRVVYDTSLPTTVPASIASAEGLAPAPEATGGAPAKTGVGEAFAMLKVSADQPQAAKAKVREPKSVRQTKLARRRAPAPRFAMARHPQFGWFGGSFW